jgi:diaminohydroxyphosphoribosylaminopyrimidine deaminase / 5-amino-6-(5-phosphoribosylamino)uracil reductase
MQKAIDLSLNGIGMVNPNPLVGAILVKNDKIIGKGYHAEYGKSHAEVNAIENADEDCSGATMFVTLEPCSHFGKTPPCALKIIEKKISKVVIGMLDPNPLVSGDGIKLLRNAGIEVSTGVLSDSIEKINEVFIHYITKKTPYVVMKTASTLDGKIATSKGHSRWISSLESRKYVHRLRMQYNGIMVGINTILIDDPELNIRHFKDVMRHPHKIIVDPIAQIPINAKVFNDNNGSKTIIAVTSQAPITNTDKLKSLGAIIITCPETEQGVDLIYLMKKLSELSIDSILLEGGGTLNYSALKSGIVSKVISFIAPKIVGGINAPTSVSGEGITNMDNAIKLENITTKLIADDIVIEGYIPSHSYEINEG